MKTPTSAWYRDPAGTHEFRYWNGDRWTGDVSDGGVPRMVDDVESDWTPPGAPHELVKRVLWVVFLGEPLATAVFLVWVLFVVPAEAGTAEVYGWTTFIQMLPAVILMFIPAVLGFVWSVRACRTGAGAEGRWAIWLSGGALAWALIITDFAGLVPAVFGDTWDWTGFPLLVAKLATALAVTLLVLRRARRAPEVGR